MKKLTKEKMEKKYFPLLKGMGYYVTKSGFIFNKNGEQKGTTLKDENHPAYHYYQMSLRTPENSSFKIMLHRYIAYLKFGNKLFNKNIEVRHLNNVKTDNNWENIELGTKTQNMMDRPKKSRTKHSRSRKPITDKWFIEVLYPDYIKNNLSYAKISNKYNVARTTFGDWVRKHKKQLLETK